MDKENDQGSVATLPAPVRTEVTRIMGVLDREVPEGYEAAVLKIFRDTVTPDMTWERWRATVPDARLTSRAERRRQEEEGQARIVQRQAELTRLLRAYGNGTAYAWRQVAPLRALFDSHGYYIEDYPESNAGYLARWEVVRGDDLTAVVTALGGTPGVLTQPVTPATESDKTDTEDEDDEEPECEHSGVSTCSSCDGDATLCGIDRWGGWDNCENGCPDCTHCESSDHVCTRCSIDPTCDHTFTCEDCGAYVSPTRDGWELS